MPAVPESTRLRVALQDRVLGQSAAIQAIVDSYVRWKAGLAGLDKPVAAFLALGPTGVGKTLTVESLAEILHGDNRMMIKIHCAEYRHSHEIARLVGAPPGYIGHKETQPRLSPRRLQEVQSKSCPLIILLFDEIEKAHPDLWDLLLGILDKGELHLGDGGSADLRQSLIFLTSNVGARESTNAIGYRPDRAQKAESVARSLFSPEFRNRLTAMLQYGPLTAKQLRAVTELELSRAASRLLQTRGVSLVIADSAVDVVLADGSDPDFGARPIRRAIERLLELPLAHMLLDNKIGPGDEVEVSARDNALVFHRRRPMKGLAA